MRNTTKKNLKELIEMMNNTEILKLLIDQKAKDEDVEAILSDFKEGLDSQFNKILNK